MEKFNKLYSTSNFITLTYQNIIYPSNYSYIESMRNITIMMLKREITNEQELINSMSLEEIDKYLAISLNSNEYDTNVLLRIKNKLAMQRKILSKESTIINSNELKIPHIPDNIPFEIDNLIEAIINIQTIKILKEKIYNLKEPKQNSINNSKFKDTQPFSIEELKIEFQNFEFDFLVYNAITEIIALYHNIKINILPTINIDRFRFKTESLNNYIEEQFMIYTKKIIIRLASTELYTKNSNNIFTYLVNITKLEVLLSFLDKETIKSFYYYCQEFENKENTESINYTKKLIKEKLNQ